MVLGRALDLASSADDPDSDSDGDAGARSASGDDTLTRSLSTPTTLDRSSRSVTVTALSGLAPAPRPAPAPDGTRCQWIEELDARGADLSRLRGAPCLKDHQNRTDSAIGSVVEPAVNGDKIEALVRFDASPEADSLINKIESGSVRGVSLGYSVQRWSKLPDRNGMPVFRATSWQPIEISFTPVPIDVGATVRSNQMTIIENIGGATDSNRAAYCASIRSVAEIAGLGSEFIDSQIDLGADLDTVRRSAFELMSTAKKTRSAGCAQSIRSLDGSPDHLVRAMSDAVARRLNPTIAETEAGRAFTNWSMLDMAGELFRTRGVNLDSRNRQAVADAIFTRSFSGMATTDFPELLANAVNKALMPSYVTAAPSYRSWSAQRTFNDFREHRFLRLGDFPGLTQLGQENEEPTFGSISEHRESITPHEYGSGVAVTRKLLINDDLGALQSLTSLVGIRVAAEENRMAYAYLASNPTMNDSFALFSANHGNSMTAADITVASIAAAVKALRSMTTLDGIFLNLQPKILVCGPARELSARTLLHEIVATQVSNVNPYSGMLELQVDANISGNSWYVFADPNAAPVVVYGYVANTMGPVVRSEIDFETRCLRIAVNLDWGIGAIDYRGAIFNVGA